jgi:hypothetical protein
VFLIACACGTGKVFAPAEPTFSADASTSVPISTDKLMPTEIVLNSSGTGSTFSTPEFDATSGAGVIATVRADEKACCFSESPDGEWLAYFRLDDDGRWLYVIPVEGGTPVKLAYILYVGYIDEHPLWVQGYRAIFYNDGSNLLKVALLDGSDNFCPTAADTTKMLGEHQHIPWEVDNLAWSLQRRLVIVLESNDMEHIPRLVGYELSEDLRTILQSRVLFQDANLTGLDGWLVQDEILDLGIGGNHVAWSLEDGAPSQ